MLSQQAASSSTTRMGCREGIMVGGVSKAGAISRLVNRSAESARQESKR
jgi:hypothetical protein